MTPRQHLLFLRVLRVAFCALGIAVIYPHTGRHGTVGLSEAWPVLGGLAVMFVPYLIVSLVIPARCPQCGGKVYAQTDWQSDDHQGSESGSPPSRIKSFRWKCRSCGDVETIPSSFIDNLIPPFVS